MADCLFRGGSFFWVIFFEIALVLSFFAIMEGHFVVVMGRGNSNLVGIELIFEEEAFLCGILHHLQVLFDIAIEYLASQRLLVNLNHRFQLVP
jgi:hypothetical protein